MNVIVLCELVKLQMNNNPYAFVLMYFSVFYVNFISRDGYLMKLNWQPDPEIHMAITEAAKKCYSTINFITEEKNSQIRQQVAFKFIINTYILQ